MFGDKHGKITHLFRRKNGDGGFGGDGEMVVVGFGIFFPFKRPSDSLERMV